MKIQYCSGTLLREWLTILFLRRQRVLWIGPIRIAFGDKK
ncbi:hypothetical protein [Xanthomonas phage vB_XooS_NR08]|nr:hypothetical protein [Xanthomonas phage vB_XooS_NR08]